MNLIVNGLHVMGEDRGRGPVALLLHGWGTYHQSMISLEPSLKNRRIVAPDLPGFGGTPPPTAAWGVPEYTAFVADFLQKLNIHEVDVIIGHSFGGRIALELVGRGLVLPKKLILIASHGLPETPTARKRLLATVAKLSRPLPPAVRNRLGKRFGSEDYQATSGIMRQVFTQVITQDATVVASRIKIPTLLIYGSDDQTTPISLGQNLANLIDGSRLEVVEEAGHYVHVDQPARVSKLLRDFLS